MIKSKPRLQTGPGPAALVILDAFAALTGTRFRVVPSDIGRQAAMFAENFTCEDLDLVVTYIRWGITAKNGPGFNDQSLTWQKLLGDAITGFPTFQDRLGAAQRALHRREFRHTPRYTGNAPIAAAPKAKAPATLPPGHAATSQDDAKAERIRAAARSFDVNALAEKLRMPEEPKP